MALHILRGGTTAGGRLGEAFGTGISSLLEHKLGQLQERSKRSQTSQGLQAIEGITPEQAEQLSNLDPAILGPVLKQFMAAPGQKAYGQAISQLLNGEGGGGLPEGAQLNSQQATDLAKLSFKKQEVAETQRQKKQVSIDASNKVYNDILDKSLANARAAKEKAEQLIGYAKTGKVSSGLEGRVTPQWMLNDESREFDAVGDQLASILAGQKGVPTNFKIKWEKGSKPSLTHSTESQINLGQKVVDQSSPLLKRGEIRDELIAANGGVQPENIGTKVERAYKEWLKSGSKKKEEIPEEEITDTIAQLEEGKAAIGTSVDFANGVRLYWNGEDLVEENPMEA